MSRLHCDLARNVAAFQLEEEVRSTLNWQPLMPGRTPSPDEQPRAGELSETALVLRGSTAPGSCAKNAMPVVERPAPVVLDASVAVRWVVPERGSEEAAALLGQPLAWLAPRLFVTEVASALRRKVSGGGIVRPRRVPRAQLPWWTRSTTA